MFYVISDRYIDCLSEKNPHVMSNKAGTRTYHRKYIGILAELGGFKYFVPLSSPKPADLRYKILMQSEMMFIRANRDKIEKSAARIYRMRKSYNKEKFGENRMMEMTLDFSELENLCSEWAKNYENA